MKAFWAWLISLWTLWQSPVASPLPSPVPELLTSGSYRYSLWEVADVSRLKLGSNLPQRESAVDLKQQHRCQFLSSAGFYDTDYRHLGWFVSDGRELSPAQTNRLLNGFIYSLNGEVAVAPAPPAEAVDWGLQSGPVLIEGGKPLTLAIRDDQPRRRLTAVITGGGRLVFLVLLSPQSDYAGPLLADVPKLLLAINSEIVSAINLDGGSASAFLTPEVSLSEYQPIGGFFCL